MSTRPPSWRPSPATVPIFSSPVRAASARAFSSTPSTAPSRAGASCSPGFTWTRLGRTGAGQVLEDPQAAVAMREERKSLCSVLKDCDPWLRFVFLTGVRKFVACVGLYPEVPGRRPEGAPLSPRARSPHARGPGRPLPPCRPRPCRRHRRCRGGRPPAALPPTVRRRPAAAPAA